MALRVTASMVGLMMSRDKRSIPVLANMVAIKARRCPSVRCQQKQVPMGNAKEKMSKDHRLLEEDD
jgi:hypothetical protein